MTICCANTATASEIVASETLRMVVSMPERAVPLEDLIACPRCDSLSNVRERAEEARLTCKRCHQVLISPRRGASLKVIALSVASLILVVGTLTNPFIGVRKFGLSQEATLLETAMAFSGPLQVLSFTVLALVILLPATRLILTLYVLLPLVAGGASPKGSKRAFRVSEALRPWSMGEIFAIGCGVALIKLTDLAHVELGPAFWMFVSLVILIIVQDTLMCRWSLWKSLDR